MSEDRLADLRNVLNADDLGGGFSGIDLTRGSHVPFGIPSRIPELDLSVHRPGYPAGRVIELFGLPASGKTTAAFHALAQCQLMGGVGVMLDTEFALDTARATQCGVNVKDLIVSEPDTIEACFRTIDAVINNAVDISATNPLVIVVDSVTGVLPEVDEVKNYGDVHKVASDSVAIRNGFRRMNKKIARSNAVLIMVNHSTARNFGMKFAKQSDSSGGNAIKFYSSIRVEFTAAGTLAKGKGLDKVREGMLSKLTLTKNKVGKTGQIAFNVELKDDGFDLYTGLFEAMQKIGALERVGQSTSYFFKPSEAKVTKATWNKLVDNTEGGLMGMYKWFLQAAMKHEHITPYGG